jgi:hypothetical protein
LTRNSPVGSIFAILAFVGFIGLVASGFMLRDAWRDWSGGSPTPQQITLAELLTRGSGDNNHITVSRFVVGDNYVRHSGKEKFSFLILTSQDPLPQESRPYLVVELRTTDPGRVESLARQQTITGVYSTGISSTSREGRRLLEEKYPSLDVWNTPFLEVREYRGGWYVQRLKILAGVSGSVFLVAVLGIVWFVRRVKRNERQAQESSPGSPALEGK